MKKIAISILLLAALVVVICPAAATAGPDLFSGDTKIYGGSPTVLEPNVLIIIDTSGSMGDSVPSGGGSVYDKTITYSPVAECFTSGFAGSLCDTTSVYDTSYNYLSGPVTALPTCTFSTKNPGNDTTINYASLMQASGSITQPKLNFTNGVASCCYKSVTYGTGSNKHTYSNGECANATYYDGNYVNWLYDQNDTSAPKIDIAKMVMATLVQSTKNVKFGLMKFFKSPVDVTVNTITTNDHSITHSGKWTSGSNKITALSQTSDLVVGAKISSGSGIPTNTTIVSIDSSSQITMSKNATQTQSSSTSRTFTWTTYDPGTDTLSNLAEGATFLSSVPVSGGSAYETTVKDMDDTFSGSFTNRQALADTIQTLSASGNTPLAESLFEAMRYFKGGAPAFGATIGASGGTYTSPVEYGCQKNYIIFVTDGMSTADDNDVLKSICTNGDCDGDGKEPDNTVTADITSNETYTIAYSHSLDDVAKYLYTTDLRSDISGTQNVTTFTVGFGLTGADQDAIDLLTRAADNNHGHGAYYLASSAQQLSTALTKIMGEIFSVNTSFVAPVVPVSPENKTYAGSRVYMGFFKPEGSAVWSGNLKKFGLDAAGNIVDATFPNPQYATYIDNNGDGFDDRDGIKLPISSVNGGFRAGARSYWSTMSDGGEVQSGGAGALLLSRDFSITSATADMAGTQKRKIYTFMGTNVDLTNTTNAFSTTNANITAAILGLPGAVITSGTTDDVKTLINFVSGFDTYDDNLNGNFTEKRSWILGDILHSKPYVMNYATYDVSIAANETTCSVNKTVIYAGANDGMLHAFNDCDGSEAWAFIPPDLLSTLQYLHGNAHPYFVDSTVTAYIYQTDPKAASISSAAGDRVVLVIGLRRGGGRDSEPTTGYYYALDVTDPATPKFLWSNSNTTRWRGTTKTTTTDFSDLGETWSEPKLVKIKVGTQDKIAVVLGGGYDNCNEDARFGATQAFSGACVAAISTNDGGYDGSGNPITSLGTTAVTSFTASSYKGRAIYVMELATLSSGVPDFTNSGAKIWGYNLTNTPPLVYSMLSEITAIDSDYDGYVDRLYMGDSGGNLWRFNIKDTNTANWTVTKIFSSNPGYTNGSSDGSTGRKIFYKPSVAVDTGGMVRLYFGTGDREHPLNLAVTDRMYEVIDKGQSSAVTEATLIDVTDDLLQTATDITTPAFKSLLQNLADANDPTKTNYYGWYIRLNQTPGEKVLSGATVYNKVAYFTTFAPSSATTSLDPCTTGNLGSGSIYALDYSNGGAVINFDATNDPLYDTVKNNPYATPPQTNTGGGHVVLLPKDRIMKLGDGIPSGIVVTGDKILIGCGGGLCTTSTTPGGQVFPVYWRQR
jgi:type IV pilus assembly protein PilY1